MISVVKLTILLGLAVLAIITIIINRKIEGTSQNEKISESISDSYLISSYNSVSTYTIYNLFKIKLFTNIQESKIPILLFAFICKNVLFNYW